ncbi:fluoride efflux transporter FluC [Pajaroellobacter abortibovis]|uniref:Fluoride-specific ion channel n=1 Tax=Pajaroellobacter abortibovis TaxID=1882918 RepID=A0A1L6MZ18_9BACT|nr:CrcB family protein [Pajaroellobacter abortibovis]APS00678.1 hypothetical protein BCY86_08315 [Pajaroellobacter abortibovis]
MSKFLWICLGGGRRDRDGLSPLPLVDEMSQVFPYGTLAVNLIGSLLLAAILQIATANRMSSTLRLTLTTGLIRWFCTYSTFNFETSRLLQQEKAAWLGLLNLSATLVVDLIACFLGWESAKWIAKLLNS